MKKLWITVSFLYFLFALDAQEIKLPFGTIGLTQGFGYYIQKDLKDINENAKEGLPFEVETINNFPIRPIWGGYLTVPMGLKGNIGMAYEFHSTGSRIGQKDYSGSYSLDQVITSHALSLCSEIVVTKMSRHWLYFHLNIGADFASWEIREKIVINATTSEDEIRFVAVCPYIEPAFVFKWHLNDKLGIAVRSAYHFGFGGKYHHPTEDDITTDKKPGWSGPRISFILEYNLFNEYKSRE